MITVLVLFSLPEGMSPEHLVHHYRRTAAHWSENPKLLHKNHLYDPQTRQGGAVFLWADQEAAELALDDGWRRQMVDFYGTEPTVRFFETPVAVFGSERRGIVEEQPTQPD